MFSSTLLLAASFTVGPASPPTAPAPAAPAPASVGYVAGANPKAYRLSGDVVPAAYRIAFNVAPASGAYSASEQITVKLAKPASEIVIHAVDLEITYAAYTPWGGTAVPARVVPHPDSEVVSLALPAPAPAGLAVLTLAFRAKLREDLRGFYQVKAKDGTPYAFTDFEPTNARRAFPCFDEPAFKATYDISVITPRGTEAVSNGPELSEKWDIKSQTFTYVFATTPPISSYLVAIGVGRFSYTGPQRVGHTPIRVVTLPGQQDLGKFALSIAAEILPWYESYFGLPFPYAKLDLVAVPDFEEGAMENAGAIFFRDRDLLLDPKSPSVQGQKRVAITVAHEMAHQWFGDLVTMKWWDDLWLNEAFASLMENESVAALRPNWHIWDLFRSDNERAYYPDSLKTTHPIHFEVATAEEANDAFDEITYIKGQACLRMLELYLSPKTWQAGIHDYLAAHAGGNAAEADLWGALAAASKQPVAEIASSWFEQPGYPLVTVKRAGKSLQLSQQRFILNPKDEAGSAGRGAEAAGRSSRNASAKDKALWQLPICVKSAGGEESCQLVSTKSAKLDLGGKPAWFDANSAAGGFYRVRYAAGELKALDAPMREPSSATGLTAAEKIALVEDSWALARSGLEKLAPELQQLADLSAERNSYLSASAESNLDTLDHTVLEEKDRPAFGSYVESIFAPALAELKWDPAAGEDPDHHELRSAVIEALGVDARDRAVIAEAQRRLEAWEKDPGSLDPSLVGTVLEIAARHGDAKRWDDFKARMDASANPEDRDHFMYALAQFVDPALVDKSLALATSGGIRRQDVARYLAQLIENREASAAVWAFAKTHWVDLLSHATETSISGYFMPHLAALCSAPDHEDLVAFFASHKVEGGARPLAVALEGVDLCVRFKQQHKGELGKWLKTFQPAGKATAAR